MSDINLSQVELDRLRARLESDCDFWNGGCGGAGRYSVNGEVVECPKRCGGKPAWARSPTVLTVDSILGKE